MTHTGRKNRLFIILLGLFLFINLAVVAVHPVGQEGERVWKVALRSLVDAARPATQHKSNRESAGSLDSGRANQRGETSIPEDNTGKTASASGELDIPAVGDSSAIRSVSDSLLPSSPGTSGSSVEKDEDQVALDTESTRSPHTEAEETALAQARETATALAAATPSPDENTTTPTALSIPTATCTPNINARTLSLATVSVKPGE
ncbi:MAG TPA: hypothetical protein PKH07_08970, partial [bacterium]|nr:hypothetical protein [bacterium]